MISVNLSINKPVPQIDIWDIVAIVIAFASLAITCLEFYKMAKNNAYDRRVKDIQVINKPLCRLIKKNRYLGEMCERCSDTDEWQQLAVRITNFMNTPTYENLLLDLSNILYSEILNVLVFSTKTRREISHLIAHIEELDSLIVLIVDPEIFKPKEIKKQICHIEMSWKKLITLFAEDLMLTTKETREFYEATIGYANTMEV